MMRCRPALISARRALAAGCLLVLASLPAVAGAEPLPNQAEQAGSQSASAPRYAWAPELLYGIISSSNPAALDSLYDAAFAAGPSIVPQLQAALKDDRTAEFAAQSLAFIGNDSAFKILSTLLSDPRDLDLSRFFYGALGEINTPQANAVLLNAIRSANSQPDRTVTEAAIVALTVQNREALVPELQQAKAKLTDPVIQDDLENAIGIIQARAKYRATPAGRNPGGSIQQGINLYFEPALASAPPAGSGVPTAKAQIRHLQFNPDQTRALARITFDDAGVKADYRMVLAKRYGNWRVASVWIVLGEQQVPAAPAPKPAKAHP